MAQVSINSSTLYDIADAAGLDSGDAVRLDYSGRGMYGDTCVGITGSIGDLLGFVREVTKRNEYNEAHDEQGEEADAIREFSRWIEDVSTDSMGYDSIFYWTNVSCSDPENAVQDSDWEEQ